MKAYILYIDDEKSRQYANECLDSCSKYGLDAELFLGYKGLSIEEVDSILGLEHTPGQKHIEWTSEYNCDLGHISILKKIAEGEEPAIVFEHDAIVKHDVHDLKVEDMQIVFLGPRIDSVDDYTYPVDEDMTYHTVRRFEGAHAYAVTPKTAKYIVEKTLERGKTLDRAIDGHLGLRNTFELNLIACDPALAVAVVGDRESSTSVSKITPKYNREYFDKFLKGVPDKSKLFEVRQYKFSVDWFSKNPPIWLDVFKKCNVDFVNKGVRILEIGCFEGMSTCWISDNMLDHPSSLLHCIDTFKGSAEHTPEQKNNLKDRYINNIVISKHPEKMLTIMNDSKVVLPQMILLGNGYDIIYVDGDHLAHSVMSDAINSYFLLNEGGIIIFDDYEWVLDGQRPIKRALDIFEQMFNMEVVHTGWQRIYLKK